MRLFRLWVLVVRWLGGLGWKLRWKGSSGDRILGYRILLRGRLGLRGVVGGPDVGLVGLVGLVDLVDLALVEVVVLLPIPSSSSSSS